MKACAILNSPYYVMSQITNAQAHTDLFNAVNIAVDSASQECFRLTY